MDLATRKVALWALKPSASLEVQDQLQPTRLAIEVDADNARRLVQPDDLLGPGCSARESLLLPAP